MSKFTGKVAIITGASSGIGSATALAFAAQGAKLTITGQNKDRLEMVANKCRECDGCEVLEIQSDLSIFENLKPVIDRTVEKFGGIDILVNNAGLGGAFQNIEQLEQNIYEKVMKVNLTAPVFLCKYALPHLKESKGCVVNVSSIFSVSARPMVISYCLSKSALDHFTRGFAAECAPFGVRVNSVNPGVVKTRFLRTYGLQEEASNQMMDYFGQQQPLGIIPPEEIATSILFLCSSGHMTGSCVLLDGGELTKTG